MNNLNVMDVQTLLQNGLKINGETKDISKIEEVQEALRSHFSKVYNFIREKFDFESFDYVVWTGGMAKLHEGLIKSKQRKNFIVMEDSQTSNVKGYSEFAKSVVVQDEKNTANY